MQLQVSSNIPVARNRRVRSGKWDELRRILTEMQAGQSVWVPIDKISVRGIAAKAARDHGYKVVVSKRLENGVSGYRIWRV